MGYKLSLVLLVLAGPLLAAGIENIQPELGGSPVARYVAPSSQTKEDKSILSELSGQIYIDGSLRSASYITTDKFIELVITSTPTTPTAGHARIWLNSQSTGKTALKIIFEDGYVVTISTN